MKNIWRNITISDVIKAIELFDGTNETFPMPRNTFLIYNGKEYPAKHIRGLAYYIANNERISKYEYNGGQETVNFFTRLGFTVQYKGHAILPVTTVLKDRTENLNSINKAITKKLNVVSQKNALQRILQNHFGHIETEKKFDWLVTPDFKKLPQEYKNIVEGLLNYRNQNGFVKSQCHPPCDIVLEDKKLIIEYDESQHFSKARHITLENYPSEINLFYSKQEWIKACERINAKDNFPIDRDEKRAFYDTVRDIESFKNGFKLVRIKHGDIDWEDTEKAEKFLIELLSFSDKQDKQENHKIARLVITGKQCYYDGKHIISELGKALENFISSVYGKKHFEFIITPGGFLHFNFPYELSFYHDISIAEKEIIPQLQKAADNVINIFFSKLSFQMLNRLMETVDFFTIGIDGFNPINHHSIELVAVYDLKMQKVIHWTGKFYPTISQEKTLIKINDLKTHFIELNNQRIAILGCHDLNVYSPRGQSVAKADGKRKQLAETFKFMCKTFNPEIILQHPHTTDTPRIWKPSWQKIEEELPNVKHFASGIKYYNTNGNCRDSLGRVLDKTKKGDVIDY